MKTLSQNLVTALIILMVIISENSNAQIITTQKTTQTIGYDLPFFEDWHWGDFETHQWQRDSDNWQIDTQTGNDAPTAKFHRTPILTNYSRNLTSNVFNGNLLNVGRIFLLFDLKLTDNNENVSELFSIQVFDGSNWNTIDSLSNDGSFDWTNYSYDISNWAIGNEFKIRFRASGEQSMNIIDWLIDNIEIYRECDKPYDLKMDLTWNGNDVISEVFWNSPESVFWRSTWLHYDNGSNFNSIGLNNGDNIYAATYWEPGSLSKYNNDTIKSIKMFPDDNDFDFILIKIWTGENAINQIYSDTLENIEIGEWNEHILNESIIINGTLEYWIGYEIVNPIPSTFPAGTDAGPAITGYGDKISMNGTSWDNLSDFGLDYNWNIQFFVNSPPTQSPETLLGFSVFRDTTNPSNYEFIGYVDFQDNQEAYLFQEISVLSSSLSVCYKVNATWANNSDTCISEYALSYHYGDDKVCIIITSDNYNTINHLYSINIFPVPASTTLNIESEIELEKITIYNSFGQMVMDVEINRETVFKIDVGSLKNGVYFMKIETAVGVFTNKIVIE